MFLTLYDLESIKKQCDNLSKLVTEIKHVYNPSNMERGLFVSREDYAESLKIKNEVPQDFYYFRCFDILVQIVYNKKTKIYQLYVENFYTPILNKYKKVQRSKNSFEISKDFDKCFCIYKDVIDEVLSSRVLQNGLF